MPFRETPHQPIPSTEPITPEAASTAPVFTTHSADAKLISPTEILFGPAAAPAEVPDDTTYWTAPDKDEISAFAPTLLDKKTAESLSNCDTCVAKKDFDAFVHDIQTISDVTKPFDDRCAAVQELISLYSLYADPGEPEMTFFAYPISVALNRYVALEQNFFLRGTVHSYFDDLAEMYPSTPASQREFLKELKALGLLKLDQDGYLLAFGMGVYLYGDTHISLDLDSIDDKAIDAMFFQIQNDLYFLYGGEKLKMDIQKARYGMKDIPADLKKYDGGSGDAYDEEVWGFVSQVSPEITVQYTLSQHIKRSFDTNDLGSGEDAIGNVFAKRFPKDQERAARYAELYKQMTSLPMRKFVEDTFGISIAEVPIYIQIQLLDFMKEQDQAKLDSLKTFFQQGASPEIKQNRLIAFLSLEQGGPEMGGAIAHISEQFPAETADAIFRKYAELVNQAEKTATAVALSFNKDVAAESIVLIRENLLIRAKDLLISFEGRDRHSEKDVFSALDAIRADIELFKSTFQTLYEEGVISDFSEVAGIEFGSRNPEELSEEDKEAMRKMYDENYPESAGYSPEFRATIFRSLEDAFAKKSGARFYILKKDGKLIGYNRFEDLPDTKDGRKRKYVGSFNVAPRYRGSKLGDKMFDDCISNETGDGAIIEAYADPALPISAHYLNENGFVGTEMEMVADRPILKIVRDELRNKQLATKQPTFTDTVAKEINRDGSPRAYITTERTQLSDMPQIASSMLKKGWLLTRIPRDTDGNHDAVIAVFEKAR